MTRAKELKSRGNAITPFTGCALRGASFTCNGQCQKAGICGGRCLSCDSQKGKVDRRNRKHWKCHTADSTDWNSRENARMWRKNLADTINAANEQLGIDLHWEHRSFKEQGIDKEPTIHIGAVANAL